MKAASSTQAWDGFTRLFHWLLVFSMLFAWASAEFGNDLGDVDMRWHQLNGYFLLSLLLTRVIWGFVGSNTARFAFFLRAPISALVYLRSLRGNPVAYLSHNPAGAWMVIILLLLLAGQATTGLFSSDDLFVSGPLAGWVDSDTSEQITDIHETLFELILVLVAVHIAAVLYHQFGKREKLVQAMLHGNKPVHQYADVKGKPPLHWRSSALAISILPLLFASFYVVFEYLV